MNCPDCQTALEENSAGLLRCPGCNQLFNPSDFANPAPESQAVPGIENLPSRKQRLERTAHGFTVIAGLLAALCVVGLFIGLLNIAANEPAAWPWWFAGACTAAAAWLFLIAQIVYIRANTEK